MVEWMVVSCLMLIEMTVAVIGAARPTQSSTNQLASNSASTTKSITSSASNCSVSPSPISPSTTFSASSSTSSTRSVPSATPSVTSSTPPSGSSTRSASPSPKASRSSTNSPSQTQTLSKLSISTPKSDSQTNSPTTSPSPSMSHDLSASAPSASSSATAPVTASSSRTCPFVLTSVSPASAELYGDWYAPYVASGGSARTIKFVVYFSSAASSTVLGAMAVAAPLVQIVWSGSVALAGPVSFTNATFPFRVLPSLGPIMNSSTMEFIGQLVIEGELVIPQDLNIYATDGALTLWFGGSIFGCWSAVVEPVALRLLGVEMPLALTARETFVMVALATAPLVALSSGSLVMLQMRHVLQLELSVCDRSFALPVAALWNPLQLRVGPAEGQFLRGGLVGSVVLVTCFVCVAVLVLLTARYRPGGKLSSLTKAGASLRLAGAVFNLSYFPFVLPGVYLCCSLMTRVAVSVDLSSVALDTSWPISYLVILLGMPTLLLVWLVSIGFAFHIRSNDMWRPVAERLATLDAWMMGLTYWKENYPQYGTRLKLWYPVFAAFRDKRQWFIVVETAFSAGYGLSGALLWRDCTSARLLHGLLAIVHVMIWLVLQPHDAFGHVFCCLCVLPASVVCSFLLAVASLAVERSGGPLATLSDTITAAEIVLTSACGMMTLGKALRSSAAVSQVESAVWNGLSQLRRRQGGDDDGSHHERSLAFRTEDDLIWDCYVRREESGLVGGKAADESPPELLLKSQELSPRRSSEVACGDPSAISMPWTCADLAETEEEMVSRPFHRGLQSSLLASKKEETKCVDETKSESVVALKELNELAEGEDDEDEESSATHDDDDDDSEMEERGEDYFMRICAADHQKSNVAMVYMGSSSDSDFTETAQVPARTRRSSPRTVKFVPSGGVKQQRIAPSLWASSTDAAASDSVLLAAPLAASPEPEGGPKELRLRQRGEILRLLERSRFSRRLSSSSSSSASSTSRTTGSSSSTNDSPRRPHRASGTMSCAGPAMLVNALDSAVSEHLAEGNYAAAQELLD